jgi:hypothetical protein
MAELLQALKKNNEFVRDIATRYHALADSGAPYDASGATFDELEVTYAKLTDRYVDRSAQGASNG